MITASLAPDYYNVTPISSSSGIFYEQIKSVSLYNQVWKIFSTINLENYYNMYKSIAISTKRSNDICNHLNNADQKLQACRQFANLINITVLKIDQDNELIKDLLADSVRSKRGAINVVGHVSNLLFGTLDSDDGIFFTEKINQLEKDSDHLKELAKYQISTFDNAMEVLNHSQQLNANKFKLLESQLKYLSNDLSNLSYVLNQHNTRVNFHQNLEESVLMFELVVNQFSTYQSNLIDVLVNAHRGVIHPYLLSPSKLIAELKNIQMLLPRDLTFPVPLIRSMCHELYKLLRLTLCRNGNNIIFIVRIPLVIREYFDLIKMTSVPVRIKENNFAFLLPHNSYIIIDSSRHKFFLADNNYINSCNKINDHLVCEQTEPIYFTNSIETCEVKLFTSNQLLDSCEKRLIKLNHPIFVHLASSNSWIFATANPFTVTINCKNTKFVKELINTGIIQLNNSCTAYTPSVILKPMVETKLQYNINISFIPNVNIKELVLTENVNLEIIPAFNTTLISHNNIQLEKFSRSLNSLKEIQNSVSLSSYNVHHFTSIYGIIAFLAIATAIVIFKHFKNKIKSEQPTPEENIKLGVVSETEICSNPSYKFPK